MKAPLNVSSLNSNQLSRKSHRSSNTHLQIIPSHQQPALRSIVTTTPPLSESLPNSKNIKKPRESHRLLALELGIKSSINIFLSVIAVISLIKLLPYHWSQQERLQEMRVEVQKVETRLQSLRRSFGASFAPNSLPVMEEQSPRVNPNQRRVVWVEPSPTVARDLPSPAPKPSSIADNP